MTPEELQKLEKERRLVLKWLGRIPNEIGLYFLKYESGESLQPITEYKANEERKWWDEIWSKLESSFLASGYYRHLEYELNPFSDWLIHTAKPEICWKALIKTLEG